MSRPVCISRAQRNVHVATEVVALATIPILVWVARRPDCPPWIRRAAGLMALGTVIVDGGLLLSWAGRRGR